MCIVWERIRLADRPAGLDQHMGTGTGMGSTWNFVPSVCMHLARHVMLSLYILYPVDTCFFCFGGEILSIDISNYLCLNIFSLLAFHRLPLSI